MRAHGAAVRVYRSAWAQRIGLVVNLEPKDPATDLPADLAATGRADAYMNRQYLDAAFFGRPPAEFRAMFGSAWSDEFEGDADLKQERLDFIGINYYTRGVVRDAPDAPPVRARRFRLPDALETETGWEVHPASFTRVLRWVKERYGDVPLYVTENGAAFHDPPHAGNGRVSDPLRIHYLRGHLRALHEAIAGGVDVRGYFAWSLLDNCEWTQGYAKRFGLAHVDFGTQARTLKASGNFFREVIRTHGEVLNGV
jgi:beta-glucosidase